MVQLDPATGLPVPNTQAMAPLSGTPDNNNNHGVGFACAAICRIAYEETDSTLVVSTGRLLTWAPGDAAPTVVGGAAGRNVESPAIAYRPDGRLWVAWIDRSEDRIVRHAGQGAGAAVGTGGTIANAGRPPIAFADPYMHGLEAAPIGNDLLLQANAGAGRAALPPSRSTSCWSWSDRHERHPEPPGHAEAARRPHRLPGHRDPRRARAQPLRAGEARRRQAGPHLGADLLGAQERHARLDPRLLPLHRTGA